jgi:hypothetical protein
VVHGQLHGQPLDHEGAEIPLHLRPDQLVESVPLGHGQPEGRQAPSAPLLLGAQRPQVLLVNPTLPTSSAGGRPVAPGHMNANTPQQSADDASPEGARTTEGSTAHTPTPGVGAA